MNIISAFDVHLKHIINKLISYPTMIYIIKITRLWLCVENYIKGFHMG